MRARIYSTLFIYLLAVGSADVRADKDQTAKTLVGCKNSKIPDASGFVLNNSARVEGGSIIFNSEKDANTVKDHCIIRLKNGDLAFYKPTAHQPAFNRCGGRKCELNAASMYKCELPKDFEASEYGSFSDNNGFVIYGSNGEKKIEDRACKQALKIKAENIPQACSDIQKDLFATTNSLLDKTDTKLEIRDVDGEPKLVLKVKTEDGYCFDPDMQAKVVRVRDTTRVAFQSGAISNSGSCSDQDYAEIVLKRKQWKLDDDGKINLQLYQAGDENKCKNTHTIALSIWDAESSSLEDLPTDISDACKDHLNSWFQNDLIAVSVVNAGELESYFNDLHHDMVDIYDIRNKDPYGMRAKRNAALEAYLTKLHETLKNLLGCDEKKLGICKNFPEDFSLEDLADFRKNQDDSEIGKYLSHGLAKLIKEDKYSTVGTSLLEGLYLAAYYQRSDLSKEPGKTLDLAKSRVESMGSPDLLADLASGLKGDEYVNGPDGLRARYNRLKEEASVGKNSANSVLGQLYQICAEISYPDIYNECVDQVQFAVGGETGQHDDMLSSLSAFSFSAIDALLKEKEGSSNADDILVKGVGLALSSGSFVTDELPDVSADIDTPSSNAGYERAMFYKSMGAQKDREYDQNLIRQLSIWGAMAQLTGAGGSIPYTTINTLSGSQNPSYSTSFFGANQSSPFVSNQLINFDMLSNLF